MLSKTTLLLTATAVSGFTILPQQQATTASSTSLNGLFDGVKEAFTAPAQMERSAIAAERETPIDRWMGWSVAEEDKVEQATPTGKYEKQRKSICIAFMSRKTVVGFWFLASGGLDRKDWGHNQRIIGSR